MIGRLLPLALLAIASSGCLVLSEANLSAKEMQAPVSLSGSYVDPSGRARTPAADEIVAHFHHQWRHWEMAWGMISLSGPFDLEAYLEDQLALHDGDAVVNLTVQADHGATYLLTALLMIFPESVVVTLEGDIVRAPRPDA